MNLQTFFKSYFEAPKDLDNASSRLYVIASANIPFAMLIHILYIPLFMWMKVPEMALVNILSVIAWAFVLYSVRRMMFSTAWVIFTAEIMLHAGFCSHYVGWGFGNQYFLFTLVGMSFLLPRKIYLSMTIAVAAIIEFVILSRWSNETPWDGNPDLLYLFNVINIVIALGISVFDTLHYQMIIHQTEAELEKANSKSEKLLANVFPLAILEKLKNKEETIADRFDCASVFFADIMGFTPLSEKLSPVELVNLLDKLFSLFDGLVIKHEVEKIKTIGDAYMVAAGVPTPINNHAEKLANFALDFKLCLAEFNQKNNQSLRMRIGINSGPIVAGVIGKSRFIYDLWGDCVNTAARMESHGLPGEIHVSDHTYKLLADKFEFESRGNIEIKGKGLMTTYLLRGRLPLAM